MQGGTKLEVLCDLYDRLSSEIVITGKSVVVFNQAVMVSHPAREGNSSTFSFQEKSHCSRFYREKHIFYRTANRHRWVGRADQGERETRDPGTRQ